MRVLMAARHPVGGIRTFLRYVYSQPCFEDCTITLLAAADDVGEYLGAYIPADRLEVSQVGQDLGSMRNAIRQRISTGEFDLLHSHGLMTGVAAELARIGSGVPHLLTIHDVFLPTSFRGVKGRLQQWGLNVLLRRCDAIHAVSNDCADNFRRYVPLVRHDRVHVILNGIDTRLFATAEPVAVRRELGMAEDVFLVGFFGRFMAQKGFRTLVGAVEILVRNGLSRPLRVLTFGWGGFIREDYQYLHEKGLGEYFLQMPQTDEPERWMKAMDVVAMPSRWEACPLQPMEALAAGVPVIGANSIGLREVLAGTPAYVFPVGDAHALAAQLYVVSSEDPRPRFHAYSMIALKRFDVARCGSAVRRLYQDLAVSIGC